MGTFAIKFVGETTNSACEPLEITLSPTENSADLDSITLPKLQYPREIGSSSLFFIDSIIRKIPSVEILLITSL